MTFLVEWDGIRRNIDHKEEMDIIFLQRQYFLEESQALAGWI